MPEWQPSEPLTAWIVERAEFLVTMDRDELEVTIAFGAEAARRGAAEGAEAERRRLAALCGPTTLRDVADDLPTVNCYATKTDLRKLAYALEKP